MVIMFKVTVAAAGTPGPLLGDGVKSTVTMQIPADLKEPTDSLGAMQTVVNRAAASGRASFAVHKLQVFALAGNTKDAYFGAKGAAAANMIALAPAAGLPALGGGSGGESINLYDFDLDVGTNGEGFIVVAEVR